MDEQEIDINDIKNELIKKIELRKLEVMNAKVYEGVDLSKGDDELQTMIDIIIVQEKTAEGKVQYEIFDSNKNKIANIDAQGKIVYDADFEDKFKNVPTHLEDNAKELLKKNNDKEVEEKEKTGYDEKLHKELDEDEKDKEDKEPEEKEEEEILDEDEKKEREELRDDELDEVVSKDLGEDFTVSNVIDAKTKVGETETLENKMGVPDKYNRFAIVASNGQFEIVGENKETGRFEKVDSLEKIDDSNYDVKVASGEGKYENATTRNMFKVKGSEQDAIAINQESNSRTFISSMNLDEENKKAFGIRIEGDPNTREYVKSAVENERDGSKSATEMAEREDNLKKETGEKEDNIMDITQDGELANSIENGEKIKLSDGTYTTIIEEAEKLHTTPDNYRQMLEEHTTDSVADAVEKIRAEEKDKGFTMEPDDVDREHYWPGDGDNN